MSTIDRASLPQEFFDTTSSRLLIQPEPDYIYARLWLDALMTSQPSLDSLGLGMANRDQFGASGASYATLEQQQIAVENNIFRSAISVVAEVGNGPGHTVRLNRPVFTDSTYTQASRTIASGATISTTGQSVQAQQVSLTLLRFGGPYHNGDAAVEPLSIEKFDAGLSLHKMVEIADLHIKRDFHKTVHRFLHTLFGQASNSVLPSGFANVDAFAAAGDGPMSLDVLLDTEQTLKDAKIPRFPNGHYMLVMNPRQTRQLNGDPAFRQLAKYHPEFNNLFKSAYVGSCAGFDIFESTDMPSSTNNGSIVYYTAHAFGPGMIGSGLGDPPKVRQNTNDNYGETALIVWLMYAAFHNLDARFGCVVYTD